MSTTLEKAMNMLRSFFSCTLMMMICSSLSCFATGDDAAQKVKEKLKNIQLVVLDVDGTLTDGTVYYSSSGNFLKTFHVHDRVGLKLLQKAGIEIAFITQESTDLIRQRAERLNVRHLITDCKAKRPALEELAYRLHIPLDNIAYIADDVLDESAMSVCGFKACPADAVNRVRNLCDYVCERKGGHGAAREVIDMILEAQHRPTTIANMY